MTESVLMTVVKNGINVQDVVYLQAFEQYVRMEREGHKKTFITAYISEQYGIPIPTLYRLIKRMNQTI